MFCALCTVALKWDIEFSAILVVGTVHLISHYGSLAFGLWNFINSFCILDCLVSRNGDYGLHCFYSRVSLINQVLLPEVLKSTITLLALIGTVDLEAFKWNVSIMTLEDFFTLTEMKDGFTTPARVEELITAMQKKKDSSVKSVGDATRQWAAVAGTIAATENKECLDLFVQLNGLWFIDRWLKDAQAFPDEASDCFVEEAISALLQAVEKLQVDNEKLASSGICVTVKSLLNYKSPRVQDKASALFDSWRSKDVDLKSMDVEKAPVYNDPKLDNQNDSKLDNQNDPKVDTQNNPKVDNQDLESQFTANNGSPTRSSGNQKVEGAEGGKVELSNDKDDFQMISNHEVSNTGCLDMSAKLESTDGDLVREEVCPSDGILDSECITLSKQSKDGLISEALKPEPLGEDAKHESKNELLPDRSGDMKVTSASDVSDSKDISSGNDAKAVEEAVVKSDIEAYDVKNESPMKVTSSCDTDRPVEESSNVMDDSEQNALEQGDGSALKESKNQTSTLSRLDDLDDHSELKRYRQSERRYLGSSCEFARLTKNSKTTDIIRQTQDMDLENGTVDALEVARLVAKEVEREVVVSRGGGKPQDSPKSINAEQDLQIDGPANQLSATENTPDASGKVPVMSLTNVETNPTNHTQDAESSLVTDVAREPESITEKNIWEFDLNQEFSSEDADHQLDTSSNPVSVVSASRAVVASGMPAGPLQFEGSLGWKGSAATSAFRPASPRRASDSDKALSGGGTSSGSRQRQDFLDFDLNVAERGDDKIVNPVLGKPKQLLPSLPSGESSVELSPKRSQRLKLDLNQTEDDGGLPACDWKMGGFVFQPQICQRSPSPASSSSCMQPSMRNFDLNDNLFNCNDSSDQPVILSESSRKVNPCMGPPDDTVISIMGTKVKRNAFPPQTPLPFLNGRAPEPVMDASLLRGPLMGLGPAVPYPQSVYGYNGLAMGSAVSLASAQICRPGGPIPYVFDSRGAPYLPQMMGSASNVPSTYCQSPLVMNMMSATPGPTQASPLRPSFDLNSGFGNAVEAGNPDSSFFRPLFIPHVQSRPSEEQLRESFRPMGSGNSGGKRKEPDSGWELYPTNYKHQQPPHL
uniref:TFIIS N-terminal domain-containing protein n=1 Tax=Chenopodium quinoa TaxID=63459 RepID=A0A803MTN9_CHEQI